MTIGERGRLGLSWQQATAPHRRLTDGAPGRRSKRTVYAAGARACSWGVAGVGTGVAGVACAVVVAPAIGVVARTTACQPVTQVSRCHWSSFDGALPASMAVAALWHIQHVRFCARKAAAHSCGVVGRSCPVMGRGVTWLVGSDMECASLIGSGIRKSGAIKTTV